MVCGSCSKASGSLRCSRCWPTTRQNRECQAAHWPTHKSHCKRVQMSPQKLQLHFTAGPTVPSITFHEVIPAAFSHHDCGKRAIRLHTTLTISLCENPPTVWIAGRSLCTKNRNDRCAVQARVEIEKVLRSPDFPSDAEIYKA
ncbi:hypothetical protein B0H16DRAFT_1573456 [Mycena metata]|uniref:MYND-type domain-containing protein n=1 Tax=Mycena metata TaxID=1033252 RepID=A0AAD7I778_9AGAR|nr:hypothetical protein B0H16DRAFT_1573456 [Mycena metata]